MSVQVGDRAPTFTLYDDSRNPFSLSEACNEGNVVLLFFPGAFTSTCTTELNSVNNTLEGFGVGTQVVGISTDSPFALAEFSKMNGFRFRLLSDHDAEVSASYGARYDHDFTPMQLDRIARRAAFVIDRSGIIRYAEIMGSAGDIPDLEAVKETLRGLI